MKGTPLRSRIAPHHQANHALTGLPERPLRYTKSRKYSVSPLGCLGTREVNSVRLPPRIALASHVLMCRFTTQAFAVPGTCYFHYSYPAVQSYNTVVYCGAPLGTTVSCTYITPLMSFHVGYLSPYGFLSIAAAKAKALSVVKVRFAARNPKVDWCRGFGPIKVTCRVSWRLRSGKKDARTVVMYRYLKRVGVTRITR